MLGGRKGETLIEVMLAFAIMGVISIISIVSFNRGSQVAQFAVETTIVRNQINAQAEALRYLQHQAASGDSAVWDALPKVNDATRIPADTTSACKQPLSSDRFVIDVDSANNSGLAVYRDGQTMPNGTTAHLLPYDDTTPVGQKINSVYPSLEEFSATGSIKGLWTLALQTPAAREGSGTAVTDAGRPGYIDFYIFACWYPPGGGSEPANTGTVVRLYDPTK